ncbi:hypothetical protein B1R27_34615 [Streptomyces sp. GKU 895]|nr:hypothetical protein B1R27_34615 [Streptomyces sp. GKU 895]
MRRAVLGLFAALTAVLVVVPFAGADQSETVACCGQTPKFARRRRRHRDGGHCGRRLQVIDQRAPLSMGGPR